jgi:hypothetical protein
MDNVQGTFLYHKNHSLQIRDKSYWKVLGVILNTFAAYYFLTIFLQ